MHTKFNKKLYASYINDFASFNLMTLAGVGSSFF